MRKIVIAAAVASGLLLGQAAAQDYPFQGFASDIAAGNLANRVLIDSMERPAGDGDAAAATAPTTYAADAEVAKRVQAQFLDYIDETSGAEAKTQLAAVFAQSDPVQLWADIVAADNLKPGDTADALTSYWMLNWMMANGDHTSQFPAAPIRQQVQGSISTNPALMELDDAQRQEMAEVLMLNFLVQHAVYSDAVARDDQAMLGQLGDAAVARFQNEMGIDLRQIEPTDAGFAPTAQ